MAEYSFPIKPTELKMVLTHLLTEIEIASENAKAMVDIASSKLHLPKDAVADTVKKAHNSNRERIQAIRDKINSIPEE